jgi:hypothetical protein
VSDLPDMLPSAAVLVTDADAVTDAYHRPTTIRPCPWDAGAELRERDGLRLVVRAGIVVDMSPTSEGSTGTAQWNVPTQRTGPRVKGTKGARRLPSTWQELWARLREASVRVHATGPHYKCELPGTANFITVPKTASDHRALQNTCLEFQRAGIDVRR